MALAFSRVMLKHSPPAPAVHVRLPRLIMKRRWRVSGVIECWGNTGLLSAGREMCLTGSPLNCFPHLLYCSAVREMESSRLGCSGTFTTGSMWFNGHVPLVSVGIEPGAGNVKGRGFDLQGTYTEL